jgi:hypothetical protein
LGLLLAQSDRDECATPAAEDAERVVADPKMRLAQIFMAAGGAHELLADTRGAVLRTKRRCVEYAGHDASSSVQGLLSPHSGSMGSTIGRGCAAIAGTLGVISPKRESIGSEIRSGPSGCVRILRALLPAVGSRMVDLISILLNLPGHMVARYRVAIYVARSDLGQRSRRESGNQPPPLTDPLPLPPEPLPPEPLPLEPLLLEPPPLEPPLDPEPPLAVPLPLDPLLEPEPCDSVVGGGLGLLGGGAGAVAAGARLVSLTVTGLVLTVAVVSVGLTAGWLGSLEVVAFVRACVAADLGFDVLARARLGGTTTFG